MTTASVRTRFAPSPTGRLHIGGARSALFNYLFAKKHGGVFVLRIEDTDLERSDRKFEEDILDSFEWLGIRPDEGPREGGPFGPYRQSERISTYETYLRQLLESGKAFFCFHTASGLAASEGNAEGKIFAPHICEHRAMARADAERRIAAGERAIIRFRNEPQREIVFADAVRGDIRTDSSLLGDFSLAKDLQTPLYNFAAVIDDHEMEISDVIRGEDHISNTPKQLLIQEVLGFPHPHYAHLPLILGPDRSKLSKRHGSTTVHEFREQGYLPEALVNFMALLGWNPGDERELFSLDELAHEFDISRVQKSGAVWNPEKLDWFNGEYIRKYDRDALVRIAQPFLQQKFPERPISNADTNAALALERSRLRKVSDIGNDSAFLFREIVYGPELLAWKEMSAGEVKASLERSQGIVAGMEGAMFDAGALEAAFLAAIGAGDKGSVLWPLRVALSGKKTSPGPFAIMAILGKGETLRMISRAIEKLR